MERKLVIVVQAYLERIIMTINKIGVTKHLEIKNSDAFNLPEVRY